MASRSDQLHSHQFTLQRVIKALALRDPDAPAAPTRRAAGAVFASVMVATLALSAVGVYSVLRPSASSSWRDVHAVIIEKETGSKYVFRDGVLYPVVNHASALLILGSVPTDPILVPRSALIGVPRGPRLGISGAPDSLPAAADLVSGPWSLCARPTAGDGAPADRRVESVLVVDSGAAGKGAPIADRAVLAADLLGGLHVLWQGHRFPVRKPEVVLIALGWRGKTPTVLPNAVLNAIPVGQEIGPVRLPEGGETSIVEGRKVGTVFVVQNQGGEREYVVALAAGVAQITQVQADLLLTDPANGLGGAVQMTQAQYASVPKVQSLVPKGDVVGPQTTPALAEPVAGGGVCVSFVDDARVPQLGLAPVADSGVGEVRVPGGAGAAATVDWVAVPPGRGVLVESLTSARTPGAIALVSDLGIRFPLPSPEVLTTLGYGGVRPVRLPSALVTLLPVGNALDPAAALTPAPAA
jgi:type VII secretion protein EccB